VKMQMEPIQQQPIVLVKQEIPKLRLSYTAVISAIPIDQRSRFIVNNELIIKNAQEYKAFSELKIPLLSTQKMGAVPEGIGKRLRSELDEFLINAAYDTNIGLELIDDTRHLVWRFRIRGPQDSPYEDGVFGLQFLISERYPFNSPEVKFETKIYHPRVKDNDFCFCRMLCGDKGSHWGVNSRITNVVDEIVKMMAEVLVPPYNYCNSETKQLMETDPTRFREIAKELTRLYAK